jgi:hypothetical protein
MEEGQTPQNTHIPGDTVTFSFQFEHEMNVEEVTATFVDSERRAQIQLEGSPELLDDSSFHKISEVEVVGYIYDDTPPGKYELRTVTVSTSAEQRRLMGSVPEGLVFWVEDEPRSTPQFRRFVED